MLFNTSVFITFFCDLNVIKLETGPIPNELNALTPIVYVSFGIKFENIYSQYLLQLYNFERRVYLN